MDPIYNYSLCAALPLMLFFGFYFLLGRTPEKAIFENYLRSRRIMGAAMLLLAANYSVHFFMKVRFNDADAAILMNLSTYFLCYWLFSSALTTLLDRKYITRRRLLAHMALWVLFSASSCIVLKLLPEGTAQTVAILALAVWLVWAVPDMAAAADLSQGHPHFQRNPCGRHRGLYQVAFRFYLLGRNIRSGLRIADVPARQIRLYLDSDVNPVLHLSLPLLSELYAVLRAGGKCNGGQ